MTGPRTAVVVTSVATPTPAVRKISRECSARGHRFWVIGDVTSPNRFEAHGCEFLSVADQMDTGFRFARLCPTRNYSRKNIGYLLAMAAGTEVIVETDDDNLPGDEFWEPRVAIHHAAVVCNAGWVNAYRYFSKANIWPRGLPLDAVQTPVPARATLERRSVFCPIQQALADGDPDVDAIYRLINPLPLNFDREEPIILAGGARCPFNSQNTSWMTSAFPLLYLPAHCSFRMCDIWRSFVAQRICRENGWGLLFQRATVFQDRNVHDYMRDFAQEIDGYMHNRKLMDALDRLPLVPGAEHCGPNLLACYETLVRLRLVGGEEIPLLEAWLDDVGRVQGECAAVTA